MSTDENKALVRRFVEDVINAHDPQAADGVLAPDHVLYPAGASEPLVGLDAWQQLAAVYFAAFPDIHERIEDMVAEGHTVATRITWTGTHRGEMGGLPPTGRRVEVTGMRFYRTADGRIVEHRGWDDSLGLMQQLGAIPAAGGEA